MLIMNQLFKKIDELIEKIPLDIRDIIQKMSIAIVALIGLIGVISAIIQGTKDAKPSGFQIVEESNDLFYLDQLKQENRKRIHLIEDVEHDIESLTEKNLKYKKLYKRMGRDTLDHLRGEKDELMVPEYQDSMRSKRMVPGLLDNESNQEATLRTRPPRDFNDPQKSKNNKQLNDFANQTPESDLNSKSMSKDSSSKTNKTNEKKMNTRDRKNEKGLDFLE